MVRILSEEEMAVGIISQYVGKDLINGQFRSYLENDRNMKNEEQLDRLEILTLKILQDLHDYRGSDKARKHTFERLKKADEKNQSGAV